MLNNLKQLKSDAINAISGSNEELDFSDSFKRTVLNGYNSSFPNDDWNCSHTSAGLKVSNSKGQIAYLPLEWFSKIRLCSSYISELQNYAEYITKFKAFINNSKESESILRELPCIDWRNNSSLSTIQIQRIDEFFTSLNDALLIKNLDDFFDGRSWLIFNDDGKLFGKKLDRQPFDYIASTVRHISRLIADTSGKLDQLMKVFLDNSDVRNELESLNSLSSVRMIESDLVGENRIFYGAPGVGKSYKIKQLRKPDNSITTVFHPDSQYSDFAGCLRPTMSGSNVVYEFRPGPFALALIKASSTEEMVYLVIEEINRASAAAVFGEIFQLLDRDENGVSEYEVTLSDPDMIAYLNEKAPRLLVGNNLRIPNNLSLYATMNSSDQAVMPMDTAFKRRWKFEYVPIDFSNCPIGSIDIPIGGNKFTESSWKDLAESINNILELEDIPEDRLLGPWFLSKSELQSKEHSAKALKGKLLLYLWDDVLRHGEKELIFAGGVNTYSSLMKTFKEGGKIFSVDLETSLLEKVFLQKEKDVGSPRETKPQLELVSPEEV